MAIKLPTPVADTIDDLRRIGRFLDHVADTAISDDRHAVARAHACKAWKAIEHVEAMAEIIEDFATGFDPARPTAAGKH